MQTNRASTRSQASSSGKKRKSNQPSPSGKTEYHDVKDASDICVNETDLDTGTSKLKKTRSKKSRNEYQRAVLGLRHLNSNASSYGRFLEVTRGIEGLKLPMPRIAAVGMVSAGKSSGLDSITKFPIFPRQATDCTKHPVVVKLRQTADSSKNLVTIQHKSLGTQAVAVQKEEVCDKLRKIMSESPEDMVQEDEIVIEIHQEDVPTLDLVDLPGVRASPPAAAKTSEELVKKYLNDPGTMVLLVVPATQSSFLNDKAMEIVRGLNKQSRTILALTKCDDVNKKNVNPDMVKDLLTDRILQAEPQKGVGLQKGKEFFGCVGIINRTHKDKVTLDQAAAEEFTKFTAKFGSSLTADQRTEVEDNITVTNLIKKIDLMFHHDICTNWKQVALKALAPQLEAVNKQLQRLGPPVSELTAQRVLDGVVGKVDFEAIVTAISAQKIHLSPPAAGWTPPGLPYAKPALADLSRSLQVTSSGLVPSGVLARLEAHQQACEAVTTALRGPNSNILQSPFLTVAVLPAFSAAFFEGVSDLKLQRFSALRAKLHVAILPAIYKEAVDAAWPAILQALDHARGEQAVSTHMHHVPYLVLAHKVADLLAQELVVRLKSVEKLKVNAGAPHVWLQENSMSKAIRGMVVSERDGILSAKTTVESIDSMIAR